ncbi:uncharacterized protein LOC128963046 [Oppia nitens]|uniref:uncharacterized protein LOC128963046 n=1 Tax=Oppia nitens TaxID=1686743 RepID=UPI0023DAF02D|nr:uncharacterized protein LOC128963046 [Oppia nitens]
MQKIYLLFALLGCLLGQLVNAGDGGHGRHGHGGGGGGPGMMGKSGMAFLSHDKEAKDRMCAADNMKDDKLDVLREEMAKCDTDECAKEADDVNDKCQKHENQAMLQKVCSDKYKSCIKKRHEAFQHMRQQKGSPGAGGGGGEGEPEKADNSDELKKLKEQWREKWKARKACLKAAFDKAYGKAA